MYWAPLGDAIVTVDLMDRVKASLQSTRFIISTQGAKATTHQASMCKTERSSVLESAA